MMIPVDTDPLARVGSQNFVHAQLGVLSGDPEATGGVALRIQVNDQDG
jgi:hypothetical protein